MSKNQKSSWHLGSYKDYNFANHFGNIELSKKEDLCPNTIRFEMGFKVSGFDLDLDLEQLVALRGMIDKIITEKLL